jgi:hypothetical protein
VLRSRSLAVVLLALGLPLVPCAALFAAPREVRVSDRAGLLRALDQAKAGTRILLAPGVYAGGLHIKELRGKDRAPILIAAANPKNKPLIRGGTSGLHLSDPQHVELRDLIFEGATGNGLNIDDGGSKDSLAIGVTLTGLVVRDVGPRGNSDGIKLSGVQRSRIHGCRIERWGSGGSAIDMVGCQDMHIQRCRIGPARANTASGIQAKGGSRRVRIGLCAFVDAGGRAVNAGGSTGMAYFRPKPEGFEAKDIRVEDCTFSGGDAAVAFVGCDGATVRHNVIYRPRRWVLRILQETRGQAFVPCRNGVFEQNVIVFRKDELRAAVNIGPGTHAQTFRFGGNLWFCEDAPETTQARVKLPVRETKGVYGEDPQLKNPEGGDLTVLRKGARPTVGPRVRGP